MKPLVVNVTENVIPILIAKEQWFASKEMVTQKYQAVPQVEMVISLIMIIVFTLNVKLLKL